MDPVVTKTPVGRARLKLFVATFTIFLMLFGQAPTAFAAPSISWGQTIEIDEQDDAVQIFAGLSSISGGNRYDGKYIEFSVTGAAATDVLGVATTETPSSVDGVVSIAGTSVYLGDGSSALPVGSIDSTRNGSAGNPLRINFVSAFSNAGFEEGIAGWTKIESQVRLGFTSITANGATHTVPSRPRWFSKCTYDGNDSVYTSPSDFSTVPTGANSTVTSSTDDKSEGSKSLRLRMSATTNRSGGWYVHGPAVVSSPFQAASGDSISFDWRAVGGGDHASVFGYIRNRDTGATTIVLDKWTSEPYGGSQSTSWATKPQTIPATGSYEFVFIAGAHNADCGSQGDAILYIDNVVVQGSRVDDSVATKIANLVTYRNSSDAPPNSRTITLTAIANDDSDGSETATIDITAVNDAPSIDGDADTSAIAKTLVETEESSEANPLASVTGTLSGFDPDGDSPTFTFGISGGSVSGNTVTKVGDYGTLTVNSSTGAYEYVPNMGAIKPLDDEDDVGVPDDPVDSFALTVSDGALTGSGALNVTIDGFTDTEPSAPTVIAVIPGDGHLSVLFDPPESIGGNAITDYEYSTDGTNYRSLGTVPNGSFAVTALSLDGSTSPQNGTSYPISIRADNGELSPVSNSISGTPVSTRAINQPTIQSFDTSRPLTAVNEDFEISGFSSTNSILVTIGLVNQAEDTAFALPNFADSGVTIGSGYSPYSGTAVSDLAFTGSQTAVNAALAGLQLKTGTVRRDFIVNVSASVVSGSVVQSGVTQSFYEYVPSAKITWDAARTAAATRTYGGVQGYLVTITSSAENTFVKDRIEVGGVPATNVWIGASDADEEGVWRWVTGPEGVNGGTVFWRSGTGTVTYDSWAGSEPNNSGGNEHAAVTNWGTANGTWNDLRGTNSNSVKGYVVEYSEWGGQLFDRGTVVASSPSVSMGGPVLTATARTLGASLSWTTPTRSGETVSSYAVTSSPSVDGVSSCTGTTTSCVVSGLTAGVEYSFTVTATWSDSETSASNVASVRALAVSTGGTSSGGGGTTASPTLPVVPPVAPRVLPRIPVPLPTVAGPVLRGNVPPPPPAIPTARVGGRLTPTQTQITSPTGFSLRAGVLNLGLQVQEDQGLVRQNNAGGTEIEVRKGSTAEVSGTGSLPRSTVQVFLPLQGANAKEIARIPVDEAGTFSGDAVFATRVNERPLPIGKQVLQVVSLDQDGQQSVVEMTVNIAQSAPAPEPDRTVGQRPELSPGQFLATNAGEPEVVTVIPVPENRQARVEGDGWQMAVDIPSAGGSVAPSDEGGALLQLVRDEAAVVSGSGFMPGTRADVWLFSEPTLLGTVDIDENGQFTVGVNIDANVVAVGEHTLQLQGVGEDGYVRAANLGVVVNDTVTEVTTEEAVGGFLWWLWLVVALVAVLLVIVLLRFRRKSEA